MNIVSAVLIKNYYLTGQLPPFTNSYYDVAFNDNLDFDAPLPDDYLGEDYNARARYVRAQQMAAQKLKIDQQKQNVARMQDIAQKQKTSQKTGIPEV